MGRRRVALAVCREPASLETLASALRDAGYRAATTATGNATMLLGAFRFALVVVDIGLASGGGHVAVSRSHP